MALGPRIDIRHSQSLVMTPQLSQAIKLLALSNLELDAFVAEELSRNPLLEGGSNDDEGDAEPAVAASSDDDKSDSFEAPDDPGADDLIAGADDDRPLDIDWQDQALETDSFSDAVTSGSDSEEGFDFDRLEYAAGSLAEHLLGQLHGAPGRVGELARAIAELLEETGYLSVPVADIAATTGAPLALVEQALALVHELDPPGAGARSLSECLALQAKAADRYDPAM
ncbi:MAG: RNA polymerase sigma-54 factor, partial [Sphingomicrobium sp.]